MSKRASRTQSKKPKIDMGQIKAWQEELEAMRRLAAEAERERGQTDTYWHDSVKRLEETLEAALDTEV